MKPACLLRALGLLLSISLTACDAVAVATISAVATHKEFRGPIKPVSPTATERILAVDFAESLQPTFKWQDDRPNPSNQTYSLAIWHAARAPSGASSAIYATDRVYYKEGITGTSFVLDMNLQPKTLYYWSVKRTDDPDWAKMRLVDEATPFGSTDWTTFLFATPEH